MDNNLVLAQDLLNVFMQINKNNWQKCAVHGIKKSEFMLLFTLSQFIEGSEEGIKPSVLSAKLGITPPAVTHMINSLEGLGYVQRFNDVTDRRIVLLKVTEKGHGMVQKTNEEFFNALKGLIEYLGTNDAKELIRILKLTHDYFIGMNLSE
jgi:DNA-binding MarR family transcriptional regulator